MEDPEAPHHMLLLRNFMLQGLVHNQQLFCASPSKDPKAFLGTLRLCQVQYHPEMTNLIKWMPNRNRWKARVLQRL